jgi:hypothetical protein
MKEIISGRQRRATCVYYLRYVTYFGLAWLIITGSGFDDWLYRHFFIITINYYCSQSILTAEASLHSASRSTTPANDLLCPLWSFGTDHAQKTHWEHRILAISLLFTLSLHRNGSSSIVACVFVAARCLVARCLANGYTRYNIQSVSHWYVDMNISL